MNGAVSGEIDWDQEGLPRSRVFDDKYFCRQDGLKESEYVACRANCLQERFSALPADAPGIFTVLETGFGTGLDFCSVWRLWLAESPAGWRLNFVSVEGYPLSAGEMSRALNLWPVLAVQVPVLADVYGCMQRPVGRGELADGRVMLTIVFEPVVEALGRILREGMCPGGADAVLMDGFAPSKNPEMWSEGVFDGLSALSRAGTTFSTFTVAGFVRRGMEARGFSICKIPGMAGKKHVLCGEYKGKTARRPL